MKIFSLRNIMIGLIGLFLVLLVFIAYRMFFQFNSKDVSIYIDEEASKFGANKMAVYKIIQDGVQDILRSHNLTQQVLRTAKAHSTPKEMELVHAAIMQCQAYGFIKPETV